MWQYFVSALLYLSVPFYAYLWYYPEKWMSFVAPLDPSVAMCRASTCIKAIQYSTAFLIVQFSLSDYPIWVYVLALACAGFGQYLNYKVYQLLGINGVYYGVRFGKHIPWVTAWPYSVMANPQYIGCILTLVGLAVWMPWHFTLNGVISYIVIIIWIESEIPGKGKK